MKPFNSIFAFYFVSFFLAIFSCDSSAQGNDGKIINSGVTDSLTLTASSHSIFAGAGYGSNMVFMGSDISGNNPFSYGSFTYGYKDALSLSASTFHLNSFEPFLAFHNFSLNYSHTFNSWFDISAGVSRYQVSPALTDTLFNSFFYGNISMGIDWKILYSTISAGSILSASSSAYFQLKNSRYFQTPEFSSLKCYFSFDPYVNLIFGSLTKTVTSSGTTIGISQPFRSSKSSGGRGSGSTTSSISTIFGLMEADMGLPVSFNAGKVTIEAEPGYILPVYEETDIPSPKGFQLLLNIYFRIL